MKSTLYAADKRPNKARRFGADPEYYLATVVLLDGQRMPACFTEEAVQEAIDRARDNGEDFDQPTWWQRVRGLIR